MLQAVAALLIFVPFKTLPPERASAVETVRVSARVLRSAEASERAHLRSPLGRSRRIIEKLSDGREVDLVVVDYE